MEKEIDMLQLNDNEFIKISFSEGHKTLLFQIVTYPESVLNANHLIPNSAFFLFENESKKMKAMVLNIWLLQIYEFYKSSF